MASCRWVRPVLIESQNSSALAALGQEDYAGARTGAEVFLANAKYAEHELVPAVLYIAAEGYLMPVSDKQEGGDLAKAEAHYRSEY